MSQVNIQGTGYLPRIEILAKNTFSTGTNTATIGGVYALDVTAIGGTNSATSDAMLGQVTNCATANLRGFLVVALQATGSNQVGTFLFKGKNNVLVDGTTSVAVGDRLIPQNASPNLIKMPANSGTSGSVVNPCGIALAVQATAAGTLTEIYFDGETWKGEKHTT